jgi:phospholipase C
MSPRRGPAAALPLLLALSLGACSTQATQTGPRGRHPRITSSVPTVVSTTTTSSPGGGAEGVPALAHVFVVVMENLGASGALAVPAVAQLAHEYQSTTAWYAVSHPSLPNYLALVSGTTFGVGTDCTSCIQHGANLGSQLSGAGVSWGAYFEGMPSPCFLGPQSADASYAQKHDPFAYFDDIRASPALCAHLQPLSALTPLLAGPAAAVPRFVWVTPSMCHSGHDCSPSVAGTWLAGFVAQVTSSSAFRAGGLLVVTWDEGGGDSGLDPSSGAITSGGGGQVLTLVVAPGAPAGRVLPGPYDHYSLLRTVEDALGLPHLGQAAAPAVQPLTAFFPAGH